MVVTCMHVSLTSDSRGPIPLERGASESGNVLTQAPRGTNTLHYSVGRITLNTLWCRISAWRQQQQQHSTRTNSAGCKTNLLERLPRLNSIFSAKIENFSSPPPFVVILGSFVSEEPKFYHQNSMLKIIVRSFSSDLEWGAHQLAPTWPPAACCGETQWSETHRFQQ